MAFLTLYQESTQIPFLDLKLYYIFRYCSAPQLVTAPAFGLSLEYFAKQMETLVQVSSFSATNLLIAAEESGLFRRVTTISPCPIPTIKLREVLLNFSIIRSQHPSNIPVS